MANYNNSEDQEYFNKEEEAQVDLIVAHAVEAAAKGENVDQLLEVMLASVSSQMRDKIKKKFLAALKKRGLKTPSKEVSDIPSRGALARLREALAITAHEAYQRVVMLVQTRPDVAARIQEAAQVLVKNQVRVERVQIREADLGTLAPTAVSKAQTVGDQGRGA